MIKHSEDYIRNLAKAKVIGDFSPFTTGSIQKVIDYIKIIVGRLKDNYRIIISPDFRSYGSGFASYVEVKISKSDKSDTQLFEKKGDITTVQTNGIILYVSKLTPYWYYGASTWTVTTENGKDIGGSSGFLRPESIQLIDTEIWGTEVETITQILADYRYSLLTEEELSQPVPFDIFIPTILADKPYEIFDCFFYWED